MGDGSRRGKKSCQEGRGDKDGGEVSGRVGEGRRGGRRRCGGGGGVSRG
jgi:hypothetical protein